MIFRQIVTSLLVLLWKTLRSYASSEDVQCLIDRVLKRGKVQFRFEPILEIINGQSVEFFEIDGNNSDIIFRGTSELAVSTAFGYYIRYYLFCDFHWENGGNYSFARFPSSRNEMPVPTTPKRLIFTSKYRYYQNTCTASYSFVWRDWLSWEQEIDWMAMSGINLPLAFTGQEAVWTDLWNRYGISSKGLDAFFTGPAFLAWGRMSNIRAFAGPLPSSWVAAQATLQRQILSRYKELGMTPVLPAFNGVVPEELLDIFPTANITQLPSWNDFPDEMTTNYILQSSDPLFLEIGTAFIKTQQDYWGEQTHIYNVDTFNENLPASSDSNYLKSSSSSVFNSIVNADKDAVWLMQGWYNYCLYTFA